MLVEAVSMTIFYETVFIMDFLIISKPNMLLIMFYTDNVLTRLVKKLLS